MSTSTRPATRRQQQAAATREELVRAGLRLAERTGLAGMSVNLVVAEAGVAKGTFFHHFTGRAEYLAALHGAFHDEVFAQILEAIAGLEPGRRRLLTSVHAYLDYCLGHRGVRALLLEARAEPAIMTAIADRNRQAAALTGADFAAMGWAHPQTSAALWNGAVVEVALQELAAGGREPETRQALEQFLPR